MRKKQAWDGHVVSSEMNLDTWTRVGMHIKRSNNGDLKLNIKY